MSLMDLLDEMNPWGDVPGVPEGVRGAIDYAGKKYAQHEVMDWALPNEDRDLSRQSQRLDIEMKRRALGFNSSADYEDAVNNDKHIAARGLGHVLQQIPQRGFLDPEVGEGFPFLGRLGKTGGNTLSSLKDAVAGAENVNSRGRSLSAIFGRFRP